MRGFRDIPWLALGGVLSVTTLASALQGCGSGDEPASTSVDSPEGGSSDARDRSEEATAPAAPRDAQAPLDASVETEVVLDDAQSEPIAVVDEAKADVLIDSVEPEAAVEADSGALGEAAADASIVDAGGEPIVADAAPDEPEAAPPPSPIFRCRQVFGTAGVVEGTEIYSLTPVSGGVYFDGNPK